MFSVSDSSPLEQNFRKDGGLSLLAHCLSLLPDILLAAQ